jgi:hypothetical protein
VTLHLQRVYRLLPDNGCTLDLGWVVGAVRFRSCNWCCDVMLLNYRPRSCLLSCSPTSPLPAQLTQLHLMQLETAARSSRKQKAAAGRMTCWHRWHCG